MRELRVKIYSIFDSSQNQKEALVRIRHLLIPNLKKKARPYCGRRLHRFIMDNFMLYDINNHPKKVAGLLWLNQGFIEDPRLDDWEIRLTKKTFNQEPCYE